MYLCHTAVLIFLIIVTRHDVTMLQAHGQTRSQTEKLLRRLFHKIIPLNPEFARERNRTTSFTIFDLGVIFSDEYFLLTFRIIGNDQLYRVQYSHTTPSCLVQILTYTELQQAHINHVFALLDTNTVTKIANTIRCVTPATQARNRRHTRIVPAFDIVFIDQLQKLTLAHHGISHIQPCELILTRREYF